MDPPGKLTIPFKDWGTDDWYSALYNSEIVGAAFIDVRKAFDTADHSLLCGNDSRNNFVNKSLTIHQRNMQLLMTVIFKTKNNLSPIFMKDIFATKNSCYSLRNPNHLQLSKVRAIKYGTENIQFRSCSLWSSLPNSLKDSDSLQEFKRRIK